MPKVTMTRQISGTRNGVPWPKPGDTIDVTAGEAETLAHIGAIEGSSDERGNTRTVEPTLAPPKKKTTTRKG